jgi:hypothetical protein
MRLRFGVTLAALLAISALSAGTVGASTSKASYEYHIGDALLQSFGFPAGVKAEADNGDIVTVEGTGTFDVTAKTATGGGTFVHRNAAGDTLGTGTWTASSLVTFQFYGCDETGLCGGRATLKVVATPDAAPSLHRTALLEINCQVGSPPAGTTEGVKLNVQDHINFNKHVEEGGATVFIQL